MNLILNAPEGTNHHRLEHQQVAALVLLIYGVHERLTGQLPAAEHWLLVRSSGELAIDLVQTYKDSS